MWRNRTSFRKRDGSTLTYTYDNLNRMLVKVVPERPTGPQALTAAQTRDVHYSYDLRNLQLSARFDSQSGEGLINVYDGFGRLTSSSTNMGGTTRTLSYLHDAAGNRVRITHPDDNRFETDYDALSRPVLIWQNEYTAMSGFTYYSHGAVSGLSRANGTASGYGYDSAQRLSGMVQYLAGTAHDATWGYGRNPAGGIASVTRDNNAYAWTGHYATARAYTTNGLNQYSAAGGTSLSYDANGNLTASGSNAYVYDIENRMVGATGGVVLSYDPLSRLHQVSSTAGPTTQFLYDGDALVAEYVSGTMTRRYVHSVGADVPLLSYAGSNLSLPSYLHADHQGSIVAISDASGNGTINSYDEYGIPGAGNTGRFQYTGQIWLAELGMYHYKARVYSPTLGRFMQTDPIGYGDGMNMYAYVGNDPVNLTDPSGMAICGSCSGYTIEYGSTNFAAVGRRFERNLWAAYGAQQARGQPLDSCRTSRPADICGMVQHRSPRAIATMLALINNRPARRAIVTELTEAIRTGNERSIWFNNNLVILARRGGGPDYTQFYPVPDGGNIFLHFHLRTIAERYIPGLSPGDMGLAAENDAMIIVLNRELRRYYWADYRR